jgi:hypothetical protein
MYEYFLVENYEKIVGVLSRVVRAAAAMTPPAMPGLCPT